MPEEVTEDVASEEDSLFTSEEETVETDTLEAEDVADGGEVQVAGYTYPWTKVADGSAAPAGYNRIGDSNVYYKVDESNTLFSWRVYYGKTTLSYTDFYKSGSFDSTVYDSVTSATTKKNQLFANADATTPDENGYKITCVGEEAPVTLAGLGHCTIRFNGMTEAELPGTLYVEEKPVPEIKIGTTIKIIE